MTLRTLFPMLVQWRSLALFFFTVVTVSLTHAQSTIRFGAVIYYNKTRLLDDDYVMQQAQAYQGVLAAFQDANMNNSVLGYKFEANFSAVAEITDSGIPQTVEQINSGVFGIMLGTFFASEYQYSTAKAANIPFIGSTSGGGFYYHENERLAISIRGEYAQESYMLLNFAVRSKLQCRRFFVLAYASANVLSLVTNLNETMASMLLRGSTFHFIDQAQTDADPVGAIQTAVTAIVRSGSSCSIMLLPEFMWVPIFEAIPETVRNAMSFFFPSVALGSLGLRASSGRVDIFTNCYFTQMLPEPEGNSQASSIFRAAMDRYSANTSLTQYIPKNVSYGYQAFLGYLAGRVIVETFQRMSNKTSRSEFVDTIYQTKMYTVGDILIGPYSDGCEGLMKNTGLISCWCNSGLKSLFMTTITSNGKIVELADDPSKFEFNVAQMNIPLSECKLSGASMKIQALFVQAISNNLSPVMQKLADLTYQMISLATHYANMQKLLIENVELATRVERYDPNENLTHFFENLDYRLYPLTLLASDLGPMEMSAYNISATSINPVGLEFPLYDPPLKDWDRKHISFSPVIADFAMALAQFIEDRLKLSTFPRFVLGNTLEEISIGIKTFHTLQHDVEGQFLVENDTAAQLFFDRTPSFFPTGVNISVLVISQKMNTIKGVLRQSHSNAFSSHQYFIACREELLEEILLDPFNSTMTYKELLKTSPSSNVYFASTFKAWWDLEGAVDGTSVDQTSSILGHIPHVASLRGFTTATALYDSVNKMFGNIGPEEFIETVYSSSVLSLLDLSVGPFFDDRCKQSIIDANVAARSCQCSKGPRAFYVHSVHDWVLEKQRRSTTKDFFWNMDTCGVDYRPLEIPLDLTVIAAVVLSCVITTVLVVILAGIRLATLKKRDNAYAPKDASKPFTVVFTDIQSSTSLWGRIPEKMSVGVERHHAEIRKLVKKFEGYEVKTIGDSFMVAFNEVANAVKFAVAIQETFYKLDWDEGFDKTYNDLETEKAIAKLAAAEEGDVQTADVPKESSPNYYQTEEYKHSWNGIRVRVGVNYGCGSIQQDPVSLGYDYYGTVVNTAARVEGVGNGGQVLVTDAAMQQARVEAANDFDPAQMEIINLGPQPLRGLDEPVTLHQVLPKSLAHRTFPPLRLDVEIVLDDEKSDGEESENEGDDVGSSAGTSIQSSAQGGKKIEQYAEKLAGSRAHKMPPAEMYRWLMTYFSFVTALLATSSENYREELLKHFAKKWNVHVKTEGVTSDRKKKRAQERAWMDIIFRCAKSVASTKDHRSSRPSQAWTDQASGMGSLRQQSYVSSTENQAQVPSNPPTPIAAVDSPKTLE